MPAEVCLELLKNRLIAFNLILDSDIVAITTDGPKVMLKVGRLTKAEHQLCLAHGIQLGVLDALYNKKTTTDSATDGLASNSSNSKIKQIFEDEESITQNIMENDDNDGGFHVSLETENENNLNQHELNITLIDNNYRDVIDKVRTVVKIFRKFPVKTDECLNKYVKEKFGQEYSLMLDCRTRWNSLANMLERSIN